MWLAPSMCLKLGEKAMSPPTLLLIEDDLSFRLTMERVLHRQGFQTLGASHGKEAWALLEQGHAVDLILCDFHMPVMDGERFLRRLKEANAPWSSTPILMLSGAQDIDQAISCLELGADDYIHKPFNTALFLARIQGTLEKKFSRDRERQHLHRIDQLLHTLFPLPIVEELKSCGEVKPKEVEDAAVLFADIVNFSAYSLERGAAEIHRDLQDLNLIFESICHKYQLEKIKSIGDAFLCVEGLWSSSSLPCSPTLLAAAEFAQRAPEVVPHWQLRLGVHYGPLMAGVVGHQRQQFDIWGPTVNAASRFQEVAAPGSVVFSQPVRAHLPPWEGVESMGAVSLKGIGSWELFSLSCHQLTFSP